jgi:hypothetical protein
VSQAQLAPDLDTRETTSPRHSTLIAGRQRHPLLIVAVLYCLLGVIPYWHLWNAGQTRFAGIGADVEEYAWFLQWVPSAIIHGHNPLFTDWGNYPFGANGVTNTSLPLLGVLAAPLTFATNVFVSVTAFFMLAFPLSALGGYALCRRFVVWRPAAFIGGLLYGFSPYMAGQGLGHLHLVFVPLPPLILLTFYEIATRSKRNRLWIVAAVLVILQFFISIEVLATTLVVAAIGLIVAFVLFPVEGRARLGPALTSLVKAGVVVAVVLVYPAWYFVSGPAHVSGVIQTTSLYRADLLGPVVPNSMLHAHVSAWTATTDTFAGALSENGSYLGIPLIILLIVGIVVLWRRVPIVRVVALVGLVTFILSLGSQLVVWHHVTPIPLPEALIDHLPLFDNAVTARYSLYVVLCAAVVLAVILDHTRSHYLSLDRPIQTIGWKRIAAWAVPVLLAVAVAVPLIPAWPYTLTTAQVPAYFRSPAVNAVPSGSVAVLYPSPSASNSTSELWQLASGLRFKMPAGHFVVPSPGNPPVLPPFRSTLMTTALIDLENGTPLAETPAMRAKLLTQLNAWNVRSVLVEPTGAKPELVIPYFEWLLGRPANSRQGGIQAWYRSPHGRWY